jgi:acetoacetate decarboxylase
MSIRCCTAVSSGRLKNGGESLNELVTHKPAKAEVGDPWLADAEIALFESPTEELANLSVDEVMSGYYQQLGTVWDGGEMLLDNRRMP